MLHLLGKYFDSVAGEIQLLESWDCADSDRESSQVIVREREGDQAVEDGQVTDPADCPRLTKEVSVSVLKTLLEISP